MYIKFAVLSFCLLMCGCTPYHSPAREIWSQYLNGVSFTDMTEFARVAKRPVYLGSGGKLVLDTTKQDKNAQHDNKTENDNELILQYMTQLEYKLYDTLRKPGISVQRAGTDVVVILVRDAIMELNVADISETGDDTLNKIVKILKQYDATFIEVAGYTDAMRDQNAAYTLSSDMAKRVGVYMGQHGINTTRMFIVGRGSARPIAGQDDIGRLTNRRVELRIVPAR